MTKLLLIPLLIMSADEPRWQLSARDGDIRIFGRERPGGGGREMKATGIVDATPHEIWKAIRDYDHYVGTMPYVVESKVLSRSEGDKVIELYNRLDLPLVDQRDYLLRIVDESDWKDGKGFLKVSWTPINDKDKEVPLKKDVVRVRINDGYWLLEPREDGKKTFATYYVYTAPGGSIPDWIANRANGTAVPKVFQKIKDVVEADRKKAGK